MFFFKGLNTNHILFNRIKGLQSSTCRSLNLSHIKVNLESANMIKCNNCLPQNRPKPDPSFVKWSSSMQLCLIYTSEEFVQELRFFFVSCMKGLIL